RGADAHAGAAAAGIVERNGIRFCRARAIDPARLCGDAMQDEVLGLPRPAAVKDFDFQNIRQVLKGNFRSAAGRFMHSCPGQEEVDANKHVPADGPGRNPWDGSAELRGNGLLRTSAFMSFASLLA